MNNIDYSALSESERAYATTKAREALAARKWPVQPKAGLSVMVDILDRLNIDLELGGAK